MSLDGAGGDGGVECFWTCPDGTKVGWQAKFWLTKNQIDAAKAQLDKSVETALDRHPTLVKYIIAIPFDPPGPTKRKNQKSVYEKVLGEEGWRAGWEKLADERGMKVAFQVEWATNLIARFKRIDTTGARTRYWFDVEVLADRWWQHHLEEALEAARPRYVPELSVRVPATRHALAALCGDDEWRERLDADVSRLERLVNVRPFGKNPEPDGLDAVRQRGFELSHALVRWRDHPDEDSFAALRPALAAAREEATGLEAAEVAALTAAYGPAWDNASWRDWQSGYEVSMPAAVVDALRVLNTFLAELFDRVTGPAERLRIARCMLLTGAAGTGKTFVTLDYVAERLAHGRPSVFVHANLFRNGSVLEQLRERLDLPPDLTGNDALALLDQAGRSAGSPVLVVSDALNESRPRTVWQDELDALAAKIARFEYLRVVFTYRSHYRSQVVPDECGIPEIEHCGFEGIEHDAIKEYAGYYELEPPAAPPVQTEFSNPLFLRLLCEALKEKGTLSLADASIGLDDLVDLLLDRINRRVSKQLDAPPARPDRPPRDAGRRRATRRRNDPVDRPHGGPGPAEGHLARSHRRKIPAGGPGGRRTAGRGHRPGRHRTARRRGDGIRAPRPPPARPRGDIRARRPRRRTPGVRVRLATTPAGPGRPARPGTAGSTLGDSGPPRNGTDRLPRRGRRMSIASEAVSLAWSAPLTQSAVARVMLEGERHGRPATTAATARPERAHHRQDLAGGVAHRTGDEHRLARTVRQGRATQPPAGRAPRPAPALSRPPPGRRRTRCLGGSVHPSNRRLDSQRRPARCDRRRVNDVPDNRGRCGSLLPCGPGRALP